MHSSISILGSTISAQTYLLKKSTNFQFCCLSSPSNPQNSEDDESCTNRNPLILLERYSNGAIKRYVLDGQSSKQALPVLHNSIKDELNNPDFATNLNWLPDSIKDFILPAGFPESVSDDYLEYMLWQFPTNVTGWICHALVTSSLLKAVGVGSFSGSTAAASAAAIRWAFWKSV